eukprot:jgi/Hompol1/6293/HPOL_002204-RA
MASIRTLRNGKEIPRIGLGTFRIKGEQAQQIVRSAIELGYRHIDTAAVYRNESDIGTAIADLIAQGRVKRADLFITSKIAPKHQGYAHAKQAIADSLANLGPAIGYIDLMLIHWPGTQSLKLNDPRNPPNRHGSWKALVEAHAAGTLAAIGISNFTSSHLSQLFDYIAGDPSLAATDQTSSIPVVNQIELHPLLWSLETQQLVKQCHDNGILVQGYSCLGEGKLVDGSIDIPEIQQIATKLAATPAQVLIAWALLRGDVVMPKSTNPARLKENLDAEAVVLSSDDVAALDLLASRLGTRRFCWDPTMIA